MKENYNVIISEILKKNNHFQYPSEYKDYIEKSLNNDKLINEINEMFTDYILGCVTEIMESEVE